MYSLYNFIISFDKLSPGPAINHKGNTRYTNLVGLLFTLGTIAVTLYTVIDDIKKYINKTDPDMAISKTYSIDNSFNLTSNSLKFFILIQNFDIHTQKTNNINYSEIKRIMNWSDNLLPQLAPMISITNIYPQSEKIETISYQYGNISGEANYIPLVQCSKSFFEDFNNNLDYGMELYTKE